jgi:c-di-GMP-binding flagellar brake protein YcgR
VVASITGNDRRKKMQTGILIKAALNGMLIEAEKILAVGDVVDCALYMPDTDRIRADAKVTRVSKRKGGTIRYGLSFLGLSPEQQTSLECCAAR